MAGRVRQVYCYGNYIWDIPGVFISKVTCCMGGYKPGYMLYGWLLARIYAVSVYGWL